MVAADELDQFATGRDVFPKFADAMATCTDRCLRSVAQNNWIILISRFEADTVFCHSGLMVVKRIVPNLASENPRETLAFYEKLFGLSVVMDFGWIVTFASETITTPQLSIMSEGGAGTPVPDVSIEVDDVDAVYEKACASGCEILHKLCDEDWGVRRFFVRDPTGKILNVLSHIG